MLLPDFNGVTICVDYSLLIRVLVCPGFPCLRRNCSGQKLLHIYRQIEFYQWMNGTKLRRLFLCRVEFIRPVAVGGYPHCGYIRDDRWNGNVVGRMNSTLQWAK